MEEYLDADAFMFIYKKHNAEILCFSFVEKEKEN